MALYIRPLRLKTNLITYLIPGGRLIGRFLENKEIENGPSQMWVASVVQSVLEGAADSRSYLFEEDGGACLAELLKAEPEQYLGAEFVRKYGATPGFLLKLLNSRDRLLAQVHPDKEKARKYFQSPFGKTESWYVLDTEPEGAYVWVGFKPWVTKEHWKELILKQDTEGIMDCLHKFQIHPGDVIFIPAGLPHALGSNSLVAEIQEPTDITLRAERFRPDGSELPEESLHSGIGYDGLMDCFDFDCAEEAVIREKAFIKPQTEIISGVKIAHLIDEEQTDCFAMDEITCEPGTVIKRKITSLQ